MPFPAPSNKSIPSAQAAGPRDGLSTERTSLAPPVAPFTRVAADGTKTLVLPSGRTLSLATNQAPLIPVRAVHRSRYGDDDHYGAPPPAVAPRALQPADVEELAGPSCQCRGGGAPREDPDTEHAPLLRDCCGRHGGTGPRARLPSVLGGKPRAKPTRSRVACANTAAAPAPRAGRGIAHHPAAPRARTHQPASAPRYVYTPSPADAALLDADVNDDTMPEVCEALRVNASFWAAGYAYERVDAPCEGV